MKISLKKRFGWIQVRGGAFKRVVTTHAVDKSGASILENEDTGSGILAVMPGDLALEIINVKLDKVIGHSYLSGHAIRHNAYAVDPSFFRDAESRLIEVPSQPSNSNWKKLIEQVMDAKYEHDIGVFEHTDPYPRSVAEAIMKCYQYVPVGDDPPAARGHLIGHVIKNKKSGGVGVHCQPPDQTSDKGASAFQTALAISAMKERS